MHGHKESGSIYHSMECSTTGISHHAMHWLFEDREELYMMLVRMTGARMQSIHERLLWWYAL